MFGRNGKKGNYAYIVARVKSEENKGKNRKSADASEQMEELTILPSYIP